MSLNGQNNLSLTSYLNDLKSNTVIWDDIMVKIQKLNLNLKVTNQSVNGIMETMASLFQSTDQSKYSGVDRTNSLLNDLTVRERCIVDKLTILNNCIQSNVLIGLSGHIESWKRNIVNLRKSREQDGKKAKLEYKKSLAEVSRLQRKINKRSERKQSLGDTMSLQVNYATQDLQNKERFFEDLERCALRKAIFEERTRYDQILRCLKPILEIQLSIKDELDQLQILYDQLYSESSECNSLPPDVDAFIKQFRCSDQSRANSVCSLYSRANSQLSLASSTPSFDNVSQKFKLGLDQIQPVYDSLHLASNYFATHDTHNDSNLEDSLSTIHGSQHNSSLPHCNQLDDDSSDSSTSNQEADDSTTPPVELPLYPNQVMPPPRYSNIRELKQTADKKYGSIGIYKDNNSNSSAHAGDLTLTRRSTTAAHSDADCGIQQQNELYLHCGMSMPLSGVEPNGYAPLSSIYGNLAKLGDISSGTSTFRRRKPSMLVAMDIPFVGDPSKHQASDGSRRDNRSQSVGRCDFSFQNSEAEQKYSVCAAPKFCDSKPNRIAGSQLMDPKDATTKISVPIRKDSILCNNGERNNTLFNQSKSPAMINEQLQFKQQLMHVIRSGRSPLQKSITTVSSQMF